LIGAALSVVGAFALSPLMPLGTARRAEPNLGLSLDGVVLFGGFVAVVLVTVGLGVWAAHRVVALTAGAPTDRRRPSALARRAMAAGLSPRVTVGIAMTLEPSGGERSASTRTGGVAAVVAVLGVVAAVVFATSLDALPGTPRAFGTNWDAEAGVGDQALQRHAGPCSGLSTAIARDPAVAGVSEVCSGTGEVNGRGITVFGFARLSGHIEPTVLEGRAPRARDEVVLGTDTLDEIHRSVGDTVRIASPEGTHVYRVVGRVVLPLLSGTSDTQAIAEGAVVTGPAFAQINRDDSSTPVVAIRWHPGADEAAARRRLAELPEGVRFFPGRRVPLEVERLEQVNALPWVLGALLAIIGCLGLAYALATTVRSRAHEFATLKTLGFRRGQVVSSVAVQATLLAGLGVLVGVPLGVLLGRLVWQRVANQAGMLGETKISVLAVVGIAAVTVVVANLVAGIPARRAARLRPAVVLRSD
jgi:putative ABC transport system permease protein